MPTPQRLRRRRRVYGMTMLSFAVLTDDASHAQPAAVFEELEEAITWALGRFGSGRFRIRSIELAPVQRDEAPGPRARAAS